MLLRIVKGFAIHLWAILIPNSRWDDDPLDDCIEIPRLPVYGWDGGIIAVKPPALVTITEPMRVGVVEYTGDHLNPPQGVQPRLN